MENKNKLPQVSTENMNTACFLLIAGMLSAGASRLRMKQEKFHDKEGNILGNFEVVVRKTK